MLLLSVYIIFKCLLFKVVLSEGSDVTAWTNNHNGSKDKGASSSNFWINQFDEEWAKAENKFKEGVDTRPSSSQNADGGGGGSGSGVAWSQDFNSYKPTKGSAKTDEVRSDKWDTVTSSTASSWNDQPQSSPTEDWKDVSGGWDSKEGSPKEKDTWKSRKSYSYDKGKGYVRKWTYGNSKVTEKPEFVGTTLAKSNTRKPEKKYGEKVTEWNSNAPMENTRPMTSESTTPMPWEKEPRNTDSGNWDDGQWREPSSNQSPPPPPPPPRGNKRRERNYYSMPEPVKAPEDESMLAAAPTRLMRRPQPLARMEEEPAETTDDMPLAAPPRPRYPPPPPPPRYPSYSQDRPDSYSPPDGPNTPDLPPPPPPPPSSYSRRRPNAPPTHYRPEPRYPRDEGYDDFHSRSSGWSDEPDFAPDEPRYGPYKTPYRSESGRDRYPPLPRKPQRWRQIYPSGPPPPALASPSNRRYQSYPSRRQMSPTSWAPRGPSRGPSSERRYQHHHHHSHPYHNHHPTSSSPSHNHGSHYPRSQYSEHYANYFK